MHGSMTSISMESILEGMRRLRLPEVDAVIAVERGGLVPAAIAAASLNKPLGRIRIHYRDDHNDIQLETPQLIGHPTIPHNEPRQLLLVDDVCVTGATFNRAREVLGSFRITTLALRGEADLVVFPGLDACVAWPWSSGYFMPESS